MYKCVIFDVDGTLVDTKTVAIQTFDTLLRRHNRETRSWEEMDPLFGLPLDDALLALGFEGEYLAEVNKEYMDIVYATASSVRLFPRMEEVVAQLYRWGVVVCVVTSRDRQEYIDGFIPFGLEPYISASVTISEVTNPKPHPEPTLHCLEKVGVEAGDALFVGDTDNDMLTARDAGVDFALAGWGAGNREGFKTARYILERPEELLDLPYFRGGYVQSDRQVVQ